jgi:Tfp pilus assembly protein PilZ
MRILPAFFASGEDFLRDYRAAAPEFDGPALLCRTRCEYAPGEDVIVEVVLPRLPNRICVAGEVAGPGPGGTWVVVSTQHRASLDFVVAHARQFGGDAIRRHHDRFPVHLPCHVRVDGADVRIASTTQDLSAGGAFVRTHLPLPVGTELTMELDSTERPLILHGQVVWERTGGMGVRFAAPTAADARVLRETLRHAAERGRVSWAAAPMIEPLAL